MTLMQCLSLVPLYMTSAIFKVGTITVFFLFFSFYTFGCLLSTAITLLVVTQIMGFDFGDGMILALSNLIMVRKLFQHLFFKVTLSVCT